VALRRGVSYKCKDVPASKEDAKTAYEGLDELDGGETPGSLNGHFTVRTEGKACTEDASSSYSPQSPYRSYIKWRLLNTFLLML
jgi:hypothetical protein